MGCQGSSVAISTPFMSTDLEVILVALSLALCDLKSLRFQFAIWTSKCLYFFSLLFGGICGVLWRGGMVKLLIRITVEFKNDYVLGLILCEIFTVITLQDWVGWGIFTVIPGYPRRASGDSQHLEARSELQDWLRFKLFTVKNYRTGPFSK